MMLLSFLLMVLCCHQSFCCRYPTRVTIGWVCGDEHCIYLLRQWWAWSALYLGKVTTHELWFAAMAPLSLIHCNFYPHLIGGSQLMNDSKLTKISIDPFGLLCVGNSCYLICLCVVMIVACFVCVPQEDWGEVVHYCFSCAPPQRQL